MMIMILIIIIIKQQSALKGLKLRQFQVAPYSRPVELSGTCI